MDFFRGISHHLPLFLFNWDFNAPVHNFKVLIPIPITNPNHLVFFVDFKQTFGITWFIFVVLALFQPMVPFVKFASKLCTITIVDIQLEVMIPKLFQTTIIPHEI